MVAQPSDRHDDRRPELHRRGDWGPGPEPGSVLLSRTVERPSGERETVVYEPTADGPPRAAYIAAGEDAVVDLAINR